MSHVSDIEDALSVPETPVSEHGSYSSLRSWTIPKLIAELNRRGIPHPASARKAELFRLLMADSSAPADGQVSMSTIQLSLTQLHSVMNTISTQVSDMQARLLAVEARPSGSSPMVLPDPVPSTSRCPSPGRLSSYPGVAPAHFVPEHVRKDILAGKDVNLASILIATHDTQENKTFACGDVSIVLKSKDACLNKKLSIPEFVLTFSLFRDILCSAKPERREELDTYLYRVMDLGHRYGGSAFYDYHRSFSAKAAAALDQFKHVTNWAALDMELFCRHFAGIRAPSCATCQSMLHSSEWCPNLVPVPQVTHPSSFPSAQKQSPSVDKLGRPIVSLGKSQVCNNFNFATCGYLKCRALHICCICFRAHPRSSCPHRNKQA